MRRYLILEWLLSSFVNLKPSGSKHVWQKDRGYKETEPYQFYDNQKQEKSKTSSCPAGEPAACTQDTCKVCPASRVDITHKVAWQLADVLLSMCSRCPATSRGGRELEVLQVMARGKQQRTLEGAVLAEMFWRGRTQSKREPSLLFVGWLV